MEEPEYTTEKPSGWSEQDERLLWYINYLINKLDLVDETKKKSGWKLRAGKVGKFFQTSAGVALITVILGGVFGQYITKTFTEYKEFLDQDRELVKRMFSLVGSVAAASDNLIARTGKQFNVTKPDDKAKNLEQTDKIADDFAEINTKWRREQNELDWLIRYYHPKQQEVFNAWDAANKSVSAYMKCAYDWDVSHPVANVEEKDISNACKDEKAKLNLEMNSLSTALEASR